MAKGTKTGGRKVGTPNKITSEARSIIHSLLLTELPNLKKYISQVEKPELKAKLLIDLLPYDLPKLQATQTEIKIRDLTEEQLNEVIEAIIK